MEVIPAIDLLGEGAVRLEQGDYDRVVAVRRARRSSPRASPPAGATLDPRRRPRRRARRAASARTSSRALVAAAAPAPVQASGGVRSVADAEALVARRRRAASSSAPRRGRCSTSFVAALGERLVVALDVRDGVVRTRGWTEERLDARRGDRPLRRGRRLAAPLHGDRARRDAATARTSSSFAASSSARACPCSPPAASAPTTTSTRSSEAGAEGAIVGRALLEGKLSL